MLPLYIPFTYAIKLLFWLYHLFQALLLFEFISSLFIHSSFLILLFLLHARLHFLDFWNVVVPKMQCRQIQYAAVQSIAIQYYKFPRFRMIDFAFDGLLQVSAKMNGFRANNFDGSRPIYLMMIYANYWLVLKPPFRYATPCKSADY